MKAWELIKHLEEGGSIRLVNGSAVYNMFNTNDAVLYNIVKTPQHFEPIQDPIPKENKDKANFPLTKNVSLNDIFPDMDKSKQDELCRCTPSGNGKTVCMDCGCSMDKSNSEETPDSSDLCSDIDSQSMNQNECEYCKEGAMHGKQMCTTSHYKETKCSVKLYRYTYGHLYNGINQSHWTSESWSEHSIGSCADNLFKTETKEVLID